MSSSGSSTCNNWRGVLDAVKIRIVLYPLDGQQSLAWLGPLEGCLNDLRTISCSSLNSGNGSTTTTNVFARQLGAASGEVFLEFVPEAEVSSDFADFNGFQLYRDAQAIVGIGRAAGRLSDEHVSAFNDKFKDTHHIRRCFLIGTDRPADSAEADYSLIPDDSVGDGASLQSHLGVLVRELVSAIIRSFAVKLEVLTSSSSTIDSPRDLDKKYTIEQSARLRARTAGRLTKLTGDLYLLAGAYSEAVNVLTTAVEDTKLNGDLLWYAGAQEALQIAILLQNEQVLLDRGDAAVTSVQWIALPDKLREVIPLYLKADMAILSFEVHRTICALLNFADSPAEAAMTLCQGWAVHRQLNFVDKLYVLTVLIDRFETLRMPRKRAFFLQALAALLQQHKEPQMALRVLQQTFALYGVDLQRRPQSIGWPSLRVATLKKAVSLSDVHHLTPQSIQYKCALLAYQLDNKLEADEQLKIHGTLKGYQPQDHMVGTPMSCLLPLLVSATIDREGPELWRTVQVSRRRTATDCTFIYKPLSRFDAKMGEAPLVASAVGDSLQISLVMRNPFGFRLDLTDVHLVSAAGSADAIKSERISVSLSGGSREQTAIVMVTPLQTGRLVMDQARATLFGIPMDMALSPLSIDVICEQPALKVSGAPISRVSLFEGETREISLDIYNMGRIDARDIQVETRHSWVPRDGHAPIEGVLFKDDHCAPLVVASPISACLAAGAQFRLKCLLCGRPRWCQTLIIISYSGVATDDGDDDDGDNGDGDNGDGEDDASVRYVRRLEYTIKGSVHQALSIRGIAALPYQFVSNLKQDNGDGHRGDGREKGDGGATLHDLINGSEGNLPLLIDDVASANSDTVQNEKRNENEWCLLILDIVNCRPTSFITRVFVAEDEVGHVKVSRDGKKRLVFPVQRIRDAERAISLSGTQLTALKKECGLNDREIDELDSTWYWVKRGLLETISVSWECEGQREGRIDLVNVPIALQSLPYLCSPALSITLSSPDLKPHNPLNAPLWISIDLGSQLGSAAIAGSYMLRILPALHISDDEYGLDWEDALAIDGCLQVINDRLPWSHTIALWAVSPCRVKLLVHVELLDSHSLYSHSHPLVIDFVEDPL